MGLKQNVEAAVFSEKERILKIGNNLDYCKIVKRQTALNRQFSPKFNPSRSRSENVKRGFSVQVQINARRERTSAYYFLPFYVKKRR